MIIKATFTGKNSLGYNNGSEYTLKVAEHGGMSVKKLDGEGVCDYKSISAFLRNWSNITVIQKG
jgi:hypothetical protein